MAITAAMVKELRQRTGSGMMECKKALVEADGDLEAAIETMRKNGLAKADKKADRVAAEGCVIVKISDDGKRAVLVEVNSETDFLSKSDQFQAFAAEIAEKALESDVDSVEALMALTMASGETVEEKRRALIAKLGENMNLRRFERFVSEEGVLASYLHGSRIGVLLELKGGDAAVARDVAMHVAASKPVCVDESGVPAELLEKEKEIFSAQALASGKPEAIIEKMVSGRIRKYLAEITLVGQAFIKEPDLTVAKLLKSKDAEAVRFVRYEVGEGIEKKEDNFAEEV
ncbi:MAG: elongation factor Ts, partial [Gammaproteobacteria bacterium]